MPRQKKPAIRADFSVDAIEDQLLIIHQQPLRDDATTQAQTLRARLEKVRARWQHFDRKDKPAFTRWRAREFGVLLSRAREIETQIRDCQNLIHQVEMEMRRGFYDPRTAYARVIAQGHVAATEHDQPGRSKNRSKVSDFEKEALFQEWIRRSLGTNPDKMDDETYTATFENFKSHMFRVSPEATDVRHSYQHPARSRAEPLEDETAAASDPRVKELYRRLVRRLHPDLRADGSAAVSALWHEVQEAYLAADVAQMEILLALSDIETKRTEDQSLAQMRSLVAELQRSLCALEKSLREAESEDAWDFACAGANAELHRRVERDLKLNLATRSQCLELLQAVIDEWKEPRVNPKVSLAKSYTR